MAGIIPEKFCPLPWHHIFVDPAGDCKPCCLIPTETSWGNLNQSGLEEIWNNELFSSFRKQILEGTLPEDHCRVCIANEAGNTRSQRQRYLDELNFDFEDIRQHTEPSGRTSTIDLKILDYRPSNLCNFKCRTCGPTFSSSWAKEKSVQPENPKLISPLRISEDQLKNLEEIYFAGGEPLLMQEHYDLLEKLIKMGKTQIRLRYNSNASVLGISKSSVIELWKQFENVYFGCSVDDFGERAEYLRKGCSWKAIVENILAIRTATPHVRITPNITVSIFNIMRLPEILREFLENGILQKSNPFDFTFNVVNSPDYFSPFILPLRNQLNEKKRLVDLFDNWRSAYLEPPFYLYEGLLNQLGKEELPLKETFLKNVKSIDSIRNESFSATYPELMGAFNGHFTLNAPNNSSQ